MARRPAVVISARGHRHITATHAKTFELATDDHIGPEASCVVAVGATADWAALGSLYGTVAITIEAGGLKHETTAEASPFWSRGDGLVVRRSDFRANDTLAVEADSAAADIDRALVAALADDGAEVTVTVRLIEPAEAVLFTDRLEPRVPDGVRVVGLPVGDVDLPSADASPDRADAVVLARPGAAIAAGVALLGSGDGDVVLLGPRPRGKRARETRLEQALHRDAAVAVVTAGSAVETDRPTATAVFRPGEVVAPVRLGPPTRRINVEDRVFTVIKGDGAHSDVGPLLQALAAEGVSARTLRQAVARVPGLDKEWDYDALLGLE